MGPKMLVFGGHVGGTKGEIGHEGGISMMEQWPYKKRREM